MSARVVSSAARAPGATVEPVDLGPRRLLSEPNRRDPLERPRASDCRDTTPQPRHAPTPPLRSRATSRITPTANSRSPAPPLRTTTPRHQRSRTSPHHVPRRAAPRHAGAHSTQHTTSRTPHLASHHHDAAVTPHHRRYAARLVATLILNFMLGPAAFALLVKWWISPTNNPNDWRMWTEEVRTA